MPSDYEREKENYQYFRTTCGLLGFIVFFLGAFLAFIFAGESGKYYEYTILIGFALLLATALFFCCVLNESKKIKSSEFDEYLQEQEALLQSQSDQDSPLELQQEQESPLEPQEQPESPLQPPQEPESSCKSKKVPYWFDKSRIDYPYIRKIFGYPPRDSKDTSSENDSDPDMMELRKMAEPGLSADSNEPMPGTSKEPQDSDAPRFEDADEFNPFKAGPSRVADKSSEAIDSKYDDIPLKDMSASLVPDASKCTVSTEEKQEDISAALSQLSLNNSEVQVSGISTESISFIDSDDKSNE